jgi:nondiscriminating glutamyl-tRNA synthetase
MKTQNTPVKVRFAPSPTGYLHVGGLRTALYNYLFAKQHGGTSLLRIEDTDQARFVPGAKESLVQALDALGLNADEGVRQKNDQVVETGDRGPYEQSKRLGLYQKYADELLKKNHAYYCFCTPERLTALRTEQQQKKQAPKYDKQCLSLSKETVVEKKAAGESFVVRLDVTKGEDVIFNDAVRGQVTFNTREVDDQVLVKSDGFPTYHLANVVDDHLMGITHVIRGEEWLPSTPKHILLYRAFGWQEPVFAHLPLLLNPDKTKLSKRQGDVAVEDYLRKGYLEETLVNFVALLGWNPGKGSTQELFTLEELVDQFSLDHIHKGGAVFDHKKLDWMNGEYIKKISLDDLYNRMVAGEFFDRDFIKTAPTWAQEQEYLKRVLTVEQERLATLGQFGSENLFFFTEEVTVTKDTLRWKGNSDEETKEALQRAVHFFDSVSADALQSRETLMAALLEEAGDHVESLDGNQASRSRGDFLWPIRVALTGLERSPSPADVAWVLGTEKTVARLHKAIKSI